MKKLKPFPKKMPRFKNYEEEAHFWDTHDLSVVFDQWKSARITFAKPMKHLISFRIDVHLLSGIQRVAARKHIPYQTLIHSWLAEKLGEAYKESA